MAAEIRAVIFDFGGVMADFYRPDRFRDVEARLGLSPGDLPDILWSSPDWRLAEVGAIGDKEYWHRIALRLGLPTPEALHDLQQELFGDVQADARMVDLVRRLRGRYRLGLLSNASDSAPQLLHQRFGLDGLFDVEVISALVSLAKPDPAIYRLALERLGVAPEAAVFVDDYQPNVAAAAALGIHGIHFAGYEALAAALQQRGVAA
jgi:epoxide hydrolase-like predicted phosphatase